jgi:leucyl-tRNA synthetase
VLGHEASVVDEAWPVVDADALRSDHVQIIVQVNGKLRARLQLPAAASKEQIEAAALADENVQRFVVDKPIRKIIVVPGKLVNVVV